MQMLMVVYSGSNPQQISSLLDRHHVDGYTEFQNAHGAGTTGRREGSRAWPGESTLFVTVLPQPRSDELVHTLRAASDRLAAGERLHVAVLPTESFF
jgi:hypothetical protein